MKPVVNQCRRLKMFLFFAVLLLVIPRTARANDYDTARARYFTYLTGTTNTTTNTAAAASAVCDSALHIYHTLGVWPSPSTTPEDYLFTNAQHNETDANAASEQLADTQTSFSQVYTIALAYATPGAVGDNTQYGGIYNGQSCYQNGTLFNAATYGMRYLIDTANGKGGWYTNADGTTNSFTLMVGIPLDIVKLITVLYPQLQSTSTNFTTWLAAMDYHMNGRPCCDSQGVNQTDYGFLKLLEGILLNNSTTTAGLVSTGVSQVLASAATQSAVASPTSGETVGFHPDGSYIQHAAIPYNIGYGLGMVSAVEQTYFIAHDLASITGLPTTNPVYAWIDNSILPFLFQTNAMSMESGRYVGRYYAQEYGHTAAIISILLDAIQTTTDTTEISKLKGLVKYWASVAPGIPNLSVPGTTVSATAQADVYHIGLYDSTLSSTAPTATQLLGHYTFYESDRVSHLRHGWAFGLSMSSSRINNFEYFVGNGTKGNPTENPTGWHTGSGMTYLYTGDPFQFADVFWPTVDGHLIPGTTVVVNSTEPYSTTTLGSSESWVGGTTLGTYGIAGMSFHQKGADLVAKKSWFMFDNEVVNLGAGITASDAAGIVTVVDNRKLDAAGDNGLFVNGTAASSTTNTTSFPAVNYAWLGGTTPGQGQGVGYYFPTATSLTGARAQKTGNWTAEDTLNLGLAGLTQDVSAYYQALTINHGATPLNATYQYVLLPNASEASTVSYAANPPIQILSNTSSIQAVAQTHLGIVGANFWNSSGGSLTLPGGTAPYLTTPVPSSIMTWTQASGELDVAVSDPTQLATNPFFVTINIDMTGATVVPSAGCHTHQLTGQLVLTIDPTVGNPGQTNLCKIFPATP